MPLLGLVLVLAVSACSTAGQTLPSDPPQRLRIAQAWNGVEVQPFTAALREHLAAELPEAAVDVFGSNAGITNLLMLQRGDVEAAGTYADIAYMASVGRLPGTTHSFSGLRAIASLPTRDLQVLVAPGLPIRSIRDLRGRRVSIGPAGTGVAVTARLLLSAYGLGPDDIRTEHLGFDAVQPVIDGDVDAMFLGGQIPNQYIVKAAAHGAGLMQIVGPELERFRSEYPFLRATIIPAGTYPGIETPVHTVGVDRIFVCRADLDERTAYRLTKAFLEALGAAGGEVRLLRGFNMARAAATPLPLHPGAARYYREMEMRR